jgi:hypothetical protein
MLSQEFSRDEALALIADELHEAGDSILYFADNVWTHDSHAKGNRIVKFPVHKPYIQRILLIASEHPRFAIYKSRQMLVTWIICLVVLWEALFKPGSHIALISMKEEDAGKMIGRIKVMADHLPAHWLVGLPEIRYYKGKKGIILRMVIAHEDGEPESVIQAYPQNGNPGRSETLSLAYWDEVGECDDQESRNMYAALRPTLENGGRLIMTSTPPRDETHFWEQFSRGEYFGG